MLGARSQVLLQTKSNYNLNYYYYYYFHLYVKQPKLWRSDKLVARQHTGKTVKPFARHLKTTKKTKVDTKHAKNESLAHNYLVHKKQTN